MRSAQLHSSYTNFPLVSCVPHSWRCNDASQATSLALCSQLEAGGPAGESLLARLPGVLEGLAEVAEKGLGDALAPFAAAAGPVLDVKAADRALGSLYRDCTAASKVGARHTMPSQDGAGVAQR